MEEKHEHHFPWCYYCRPGRSSLGWLFLLIGLAWLASNVGWIPANVSFWAIAFVVFGVYLLVRPRRR